MFQIPDKRFWPQKAYASWEFNRALDVAKCDAKRRLSGHPRFRKKYLKIRFLSLMYKMRRKEHGKSKRVGLS